MKRRYRMPAVEGELNGRLPPTDARVNNAKSSVPLPRYAREGD